MRNKSRSEEKSKYVLKEKVIVIRVAHSAFI